MIRTDWQLSEVETLYHLPLMQLIYKAAQVHMLYQKIGCVQVCTLLSIKTGGCKEDCSYCSQSARYKTNLKVEKLMDTEAVLEKAKEAKERGSTRFCMGAAWREIRDNKDFDRILTMIRGVKAMGMEVCCTLGMLTETQAQQLKEAGLHAYNHNLDTSKDFYPQVISTRTYQDRLDTIARVQEAGISVCCGGIIGLGEQHEDRIQMLHTLATLSRHPESVPINALVPIKGTPLAFNPEIDIWDMVRMIAIARILMPRAMVRLSAGRSSMSAAEQALCFMAGANSVFAGEKLLTTPNDVSKNDDLLFKVLGLEPLPAYQQDKNTHLTSSFS